MAGDHKCPVCQSTFTRPQHVARHMRSHTGDRPYKCQHCGDQFARSDLLSRHINKCHASEKPPTTTAPSRRKGTAAASRATTSKQACDQCVTASLPCDGANPCSKCVQRKCRCTYVKFHRQTAPAGPGHPVPTMPISSGRHSISLGAPRLPDDFLLGPPPGSMPMSTMYPSPHQYQMSHSAVYHNDYNSLPPLASALAPQDHSMPAMLQREPMTSPDTMARFRAQAELLNRAGVMANGSLNVPHAPQPTVDSTAALPSLYSNPGSHYDTRYDMSSQWDATRQYNETKDFEVPYGPRSQSHITVPSYSAAGAAGGEPSLQTHPPTTVITSYDGVPSAPMYHPNGASQSYHPQHQHARSDSSEGDFNSDAGSTGTGPSHSIPSSANSSAVHLPLPGFSHIRTRPDLDGVKDGFHAPNPNAPEGEGGFSSAFGLMSLEDPNVLAGIASDGQPFFSGLNFANNSKSDSNNHNGLPLATPTQDMIAHMKSAGGREGMDNREMQEFWKMYLRTPLNSSGNHGMAFPQQTPTGPGLELGHIENACHSSGRPSQSRRHSRVASLPSIKTPPLYAQERFDGNLYSPRPSTGDYDAHHHAGYSSTARGTVHDGEDLRSYERAVLARNAPMTLNIAPKRKASIAHSSTSQGSSASSSGSAIGKSKSTSPIVPHAGFPGGLQQPSGGSKIVDILNRPQSSGSTRPSSSEIGHSSSSMLNPTGMSNHALAPLQQSSYPPPSSTPQLHEYDYEYASSSSYRPSFKRIASQTLEPANAKRALLRPAGWDIDEGGGGHSGVHMREEDERAIAHG